MYENEINILGIDKKHDNLIQNAVRFTNVSILSWSELWILTLTYAVYLVCVTMII